MKTLFVVEDEEKISQLLCMKLAGRGYCAVPFFNGADAWDALHKVAPPDLVLSDVLMPRMTGFELLEKIRNSPELKGIPVILLTSVSMEEDVVKGLEMGANDYVVKPFSVAELVARIKKWT
jgi:two-component system, OmpR family, alkaline phosphatase synthesis response regulator PhoP